MPRVPLKQWKDIIEMSIRGYPQRDLALVTGLQLKTVNRIIQAYRDEGRINDALNHRQPRSTTNDQDLCIVAAVNEVQWTFEVLLAWQT